MRGPLKEQIQNAINKALHESLGLNPGGDSQAAYINVGGRRRNRKKNKNKKSNGVKGSAWSTIYLHANEPPVRSRVDIPPKAKGASPQVTKAKKTCKDIKARLSPPRCRKDGDQDDKPLIDKDAADDGNQVDQENIDPSKMPFSDIFKTTKAKKSKKGKDKDATDKSDKDDGTSNKAASEPQHDRTPVAQTADDVTTVTPSSESATLATPPVVKEEEEKEKGGEVVQAEAADVTRSKAPDVAREETKANTSDGKTDLLAAGKDSPAVLYTSETSEVTTAMGEGPQLTLQTKDGAAVVDAQPVKADGSLPPETGREKESLLHDPNPDAMICCTIL